MFASPLSSRLWHFPLTALPLWPNTGYSTCTGSINSVPALHKMTAKVVGFNNSTGTYHVLQGFPRALQVIQFGSRRWLQSWLTELLGWPRAGVNLRRVHLQTLGRQGLVISNVLWAQSTTLESKGRQGWGSHVTWGKGLGFTPGPGITTCSQEFKDHSQEHYSWCTISIYSLRKWADLAIFQVAKTHSYFVFGKMEI